jgi:2-keto-4-pentenoate hydratase/2-oxohepta-3-ene-1,7-dioic acid hydratase in catechol pathway
MKLCHYDDGQAGLIIGEEVYPIGEVLVRAGDVQPGYTMLDVVRVLAANPSAMKPEGKPRPLSSVKLRAPLENPPTIWCAAVNYRAHQEEMKSRVQSLDDRSGYSKDDLMAEFFMKPVTSIVGPAGTVVLPKISKLVDFECELCAVIGRTARKVSEASALEYIFGYTILWDMSQRDPWGIGRQNTRNIRKGFDTFTGLGPWIVTADEIPNPHDLRFQVEQNGKVVMNAWTGDMITNLHDHIRFLSDVLTLRPGTLISTGTPAGVSKLNPGDRLKGTMDRIGSMELRVAAEMG